MHFYNESILYTDSINSFLTLSFHIDLKQKFYSIFFSTDSNLYLVMLMGKKRLKFGNVIMCMGRKIYENEGMYQSVYHHIRMKHIDKLWKNFITAFSVRMLSHYGIMFGMLYAYFHENIRFTPLGIHLPYFERDSDSEFIISMSFQGVIAAYTIVGSYIGEMAMCTVNSTILMFPDMICLNLTKFYDEFKMNGICMKARARMRNAFIQIQDFNEYVRESAFFFLSFN